MSQSVSAARRIPWHFWPGPSSKAESFRRRQPESERFQLTRKGRKKKTRQATTATARDHHQAARLLPALVGGVNNLTGEEGPEKVVFFLGSRCAVPAPSFEEEGFISGWWGWLGTEEVPPLRAQRALTRLRSSTIKDAAQDSLDDVAARRLWARLERSAASITWRYAPCTRGTKRTGPLS